VHIADMLAARPVPAAGIFVTLTRRCPLACAHCSTNSMLSSEQQAADPFEQFAATFTAADHPGLVWFTGGEPLLRPGLVRSLAARCQAVGAATAMITGGYFARESGKVSSALWGALTAVDHVVFSLDAFHERQVPRRAVFAVVRKLLEAGRDVSFQLVGTGADDRYLAGLTSGIRQAFDDRVPMLVARLAAVGRAKNLLELPAPCGGPRGQSADPCTMAAWPVIAFDGTIIACCNQEAVDGPPPDHLRLGHAAEISWPELAARVRRDAVLQALRVVGPEYLAAAGRTGPLDGRYCGTCHQLPRRPGALAAAAAMAARPTFATVAEQVVSMQVAAGAHGFASVYGISEYAGLVMLGHPGRSRACAS
jgi:pyruvate-formate lyase-activating enzyme